MYDTNPYPDEFIDPDPTPADGYDRDEVMAATGWADDDFGLAPEPWGDPDPERQPLPFFVFGTLRPGCGNDRLWHDVAHCKYDGTARIIGWRLVGQGFPYAIPAASEQAVGTLIYPDADRYEQVKAHMDNLEGVPFHYTRELVAVLIPDGAIVAWMYVKAHIEPEWAAWAPEVEGNDWKADRITNVYPDGWRGPSSDIVRLGTDTEQEAL